MPEFVADRAVIRVGMWEANAVAKYLEDADLDVTVELGSADQGSAGKGVISYLLRRDRNSNAIKLTGIVLKTGRLRKKQ